MKYQTKPQTIETYFWSGCKDQDKKNNKEPEPDWLNEAVKSHQITFVNAGTDSCHMKVKSKRNPLRHHTILLDSYIIKACDGEIYGLSKFHFERDVVNSDEWIEFIELTMTVEEINEAVDSATITEE